MSRSRKRPSMADQADRHELYEASVQDPETELEFVSDTFQALSGRALRRIREAFAGLPTLHAPGCDKMPIMKRSRLIWIEKCWAGAPSSPGSHG